MADALSPRCPHCGEELSLEIVADASKDQRIVMRLAPQPGSLFPVPLAAVAAQMGVEERWRSRARAARAAIEAAGYAIVPREPSESAIQRLERRLGVPIFAAPIREALDDALAEARRQGAEVMREAALAAVHHAALSSDCSDDPVVEDEIAGFADDVSAAIRALPLPDDKKPGAG